MPQQKRKILYTPYPNKPTDNGAQIKNVALLRELGYNVIGEPESWKDRIKFIIKSLRERDIDTVIVNFHENLFRHRSGKIKITGIPIYLVSLIIFRLMSKDLIYFKHNYYPHAFKKNWRRLIAIYLMRLGETIATKRASFSPHLVKKKYNYIPHPLYELKTSDEIKTDKKVEGLNGDYYVIFGWIERYKGIDRIVAEWEKDSYLVIAGDCKPAEQNYLEDIKKLAIGKRVLFINRFIQDSEIQKVIRNSKGLILPNSGSDMIVSGSFYYGLSLNVPIYAISSDFFEEICHQSTARGMPTPLIVAENPKQLVERVGNDRLSITHEQLEDFKRHNFSDRQVKKHWEKLLVGVN